MSKIQDVASVLGSRLEEFNVSFRRSLRTNVLSGSIKVSGPGAQRMLFVFSCFLFMFSVCYYCGFSATHAHPQRVSSMESCTELNLGGVGEVVWGGG